MMFGARLIGVRSVNVIMLVSKRKFIADPSVQIRLYGRRPMVKWKESIDEAESAKSPAKIEWSDEQKRVIVAVEEGKSVFISGAAGTGKTLLLKHIIKILKKRYSPTKVFATASTGVASCALNGQTVFSFAGLGHLGPMGERRNYLAQVFSRKKTLNRWMSARALVIDEISMIDGELFEILERIARTVRGANSPWGGIHIVAGGDFFQLPPVTKKRLSPEAKEFAFEADCWGTSFDLQIELERIYRQTDPKFVKLLQGIRRGECDAEGLEIIKRRSFSDTPLDSSVVEMYPKNMDVTRVNEERLRGLNQERVVVFKADDLGESTSVRELSKGIAPDEIALCEGARVMLVKNLNTRKKLVNGSTGTVVGFSEVNSTPEKDFGAVCADGLVPVVKFDHGLTVVIEPEMWVVEKGYRVVAQRLQLPLILAWSVSIHKCQGMTLDSLSTDLSKAFDYGMVYVALSRVRSFEGLYLSGFEPSTIMAHPKVVKFYDSLAKEQNRNEDHVSNEPPLVQFRPEKPPLIPI